MKQACTSARWFAFADNDMDAGSCVDGRLTSAWNWCQNLKSKEFYPIFLLAGFTSFDGGLATEMS